MKHRQLTPDDARAQKLRERRRQRIRVIQSLEGLALRIRVRSVFLDHIDAELDAIERRIDAMA